MIKNPHLVKKLREEERKIDVPFDQKVRRYDEMYEIAIMLNPELQNNKNEHHLNHIIKLAEKLRELSKLDKNVETDSI